MNDRDFTLAYLEFWVERVEEGLARAIEMVAPLQRARCHGTKHLKDEIPRKRLSTDVVQIYSTDGILWFLQ
jgi:hypothetical protein